MFKNLFSEHSGLKNIQTSLSIYFNLLLFLDLRREGFKNVTNFLKEELLLISSVLDVSKASNI